jgi:hypothetical protein
MMKKTVVLSLAATLALFVVSPLSAGNKADHSCCATAASNSDTLCLNYATLNLSTDQKSKIEAWQAECTKAGCTKESRRTFLKQAKGVLTADQFAKLKQQCNAKAAKA